MLPVLKNLSWKHVRRISLRLLLVLLVLAAVGLFVLVKDFLVLWPVHRHQDPFTVAIEEKELVGHVQFLAQPALKGRKPFSMGSRVARKYIVDHFGALGLVPCGQAAGYEQSLRIGTNVIGVLPGSDPALNQQYVLISAHYDHLGGRCLGACDNASGVAALLEIAERLASSDRKPRRSICFAAFDCEEEGLLGSLSFTLRDDFAAGKIVAVENIDMLGRSCLEVMDNTLFVAGTTGLPNVRHRIQASGDEHGIRTLFLGNGVAQISSDMASFVFPEFDPLNSTPPTVPPSLFFTCGPYADYHEKGDTADKIDYAAVQRAADMIADLAEDLASTPDIETRKETTGPDFDELLTLKTLGSEIIKHAGKFDLSDEERPAGQEALALANSLIASNQYRSEDRLALFEKGFPVFLNWLPKLAKAMGADRLPDVDKEDPQKAAKETRKEWLTNLQLAELMPALGPAWFKTFRDILRDVNKRSLFSLLFHGIDYERILHHLDDRWIKLEPLDNGRYRLCGVVAATELILQVKPLFRGGYGQVETSFCPLNCEGTRDEIVDYCLLGWLEHSTDAGGHAAFLKAIESDHPIERKKYLRHWDLRCNDKTYDKVWQRIFERLPAQDGCNTPSQWLAWRLHSGNYANEVAFLLDCLKGGNGDIQVNALWCGRRIQASPEGGQLAGLVLDMLKNERLRPDVRAVAAERFARLDYRGLIKLADFVEDKTEILTKQKDAIMGIGNDSSGVAFTWKCIHEEEEPLTLGKSVQHILQMVCPDKVEPTCDAWRKYWTGPYKVIIGSAFPLLPALDDVKVGFALGF